MPDFRKWISKSGRKISLAPRLRNGDRDGKCTCQIIRTLERKLVSLRKISFLFMKLSVSAVFSSEKEPGREELEDFNGYGRKHLCNTVLL